MTTGDHSAPVNTDYVSPAISIGWTGLHINPDAYDLVESAWQELFKEPAWAEWMAAHRATLYSEPAMYLWVEDRADTRSSKRNGTKLYVPESVFDDTASIREVARGIVSRIYTLRAEQAGIPAPPPV